MHELLGHFLRSLDRQALAAVDRERMVGRLKRYRRPPSVQFRMRERLQAKCIGVKRHLAAQPAKVLVSLDRIVPGVAVAPKIFLAHRNPDAPQERLIDAPDRNFQANPNEKIKMTIGMDDAGIRPQFGIVQAPVFRQGGVLPRRIEFKARRSLMNP